MAHTPAPWKIGNAFHSVIAEQCPAGDPESCSMCRTTVFSDGYRSSNWEGYGGHLIGESMSRGDMDLISAAPDLLAAAHVVVHFFRSDHTELEDLVSMLEQLHTAIAKAEGRQQLVPVSKVEGRDA
jgi:hypothetical protein